MDGIARPSAKELDGSYFDLLVIGGGITGAGVAQDAASRGLRTLLVEKGDFASGTSSKSTKLIHGGLRYLANMQFGVTYESLKERELQQKLAPHMVRALPFVIPCYKGSFFKNLKMRLGLWIYDLLGGFHSRLHHRKISKEETLYYCPGLKKPGLNGALLYFDCRTDDARHTLEVLRSAVGAGAVVANYFKMQKAIRSGNGSLIGAQLRDELSGEPASVFAGQIVNATGVWSQETAIAAKSEFQGELLPSKGVHICLSKSRLPLNSAVIIDSVYDSRFLFAVPWYDHVLVGTTDTEYDGELDSASVNELEVEYILAALNKSFPEAGLDNNDVLASFCGLRPLVKEAGSKKTSDLSRKHSLTLSADGLISISGGKLTTYRLMAEQTVNLCFKRLMKSFRRSRTSELMLGGFERHDGLMAIKEDLHKKALSLGLSASSAAYLFEAYGKHCYELFELTRTAPQLLEPLLEGEPYILAQVLYAIRHESARTIEDVLARRLRLAFLDRSLSLRAALKISGLMAQELSDGKPGLKERLLRDFETKSRGSACGQEFNYVV